MKRPVKSPLALRTIGEVSEDMNVPQHVLRFWETKFSQLTPTKRKGNRRYYRPEDLILLRKIQTLLYEDGYTIRGVQKLLGQKGMEVKKDNRTIDTHRSAVGESSEKLIDVSELKALISELERIRNLV